MQLYEQIEKSADEEFIEMYSGDKRKVKSFLKQSFIKFLEGECERLFSTRKPVTFVMGKPQSAYSADDAYNMAIIDQIDYYQNMIKELQK